MRKIIYTIKRLVITRDGLLQNLIKFIKYRSTDFTVGSQYWYFCLELLVLRTDPPLIQTKKEEKSTFVKKIPT